MALTKRTQDGGTEVVEAKAGKVRQGGGAGEWHAWVHSVGTPWAGQGRASSTEIGWGSKRGHGQGLGHGGEQCRGGTCKLEYNHRPQPPDPQGSATLSMAYAAALFADSVLRGLNGGCMSCALHAHRNSAAHQQHHFTRRCVLWTDAACSMCAGDTRELSWCISMARRGAVAVLPA